MDLFDAASFFDDAEVADGYSGAFLFYGQLDLYDDSKRDGVGVDRRILSLSPDLVPLVPAHRLVMLADHRWLVGQEQPDSFQGEVVRRKLVIQQADEQVTHGSAGSLLSGLAQTQEYAGLVWIKGQKYQTVTSEVSPVYNVFLGAGSTVEQSHFLTILGRLHYVRSVYMSAGGFKVAECAELPADCLQTVSFKIVRLDPVTGQKLPGAVVSAQALVMAFFEEYRMVSQAMLRPSKGDIQMRALQTDLAGARAGDTVTLASGAKMNIVTLLPEADGTFLVHLTA